MRGIPQRIGDPLRIVIFGSTGMLGHKLAQMLSPDFETLVTVRGAADTWRPGIPVQQVVGDVDVVHTPHLLRVLDEYQPSAVLNAVGVVKQVVGGHDPAETVSINGVYPKLLSGICAARGIRLIHYSTDCVFSGAAASERGPNGYRETDLPDARDLYGMSKFLGEPDSVGSLVIRTSIIGRELRERKSLVEWFLAQGNGPVKGFTRALFTGVTTRELARVTGMLLRDYPQLDGLWNVAASPIDKYALLHLVKDIFRRSTQIVADSSFYCDRRLDGGKFSKVTGWKAPAWPDMIAAMRDDSFDYAMGDQ